MQVRSNSIDREHWYGNILYYFVRKCFGGQFFDWKPRHSITCVPQCILVSFSVGEMLCRHQILKWQLTWNVFFIACHEKILSLYFDGICVHLLQNLDLNLNKTNSKALNICQFGPSASSPHAFFVLQLLFWIELVHSSKLRKTLWNKIDWRKLTKHFANKLLIDENVKSSLLSQCFSIVFQVAKPLQH